MLKIFKLKYFYISFACIFIVIIIFSLRTTIVIENSGEYKIIIKEKEHEAKDIFKKKLWPGNYKIKIKKIGYEEQEESIKITYLGKKIIKFHAKPIIVTIENFVKNIVFEKNFAFYLNDKNQLAKRNLSTGEVEIIFSEILTNIEHLSWSTNKKRVILINKDTKPKTYLLDIAKKNISLINGEFIRAGNWSEDDKKVILISRDRELNTLVVGILNTENGNIARINKDTINPEFINWSEKNNIAFYSTIEIGESEPIFEFFDINNLQSLYYTNNFVEKAIINNNNDFVFYSWQNKNNIKGINKFNMSNNKSEEVYKGDYNFFGLINNDLFILEKSNQILLINYSNMTKKNYKINHDLGYINNLTMVDNKLYFESLINNKRSLYSLILE